jgi:hypothetical protein
LAAGADGAAISPGHGCARHREGGLHQRGPREIKKIAKAKPTEYDLPFSTWSLAKPADFVVAEGVADDISHEGLRVLLAICQSPGDPITCARYRKQVLRPENHVRVPTISVAASARSAFSRAVVSAFSACPGWRSVARATTRSPARPLS